MTSGMNTVISVSKNSVPYSASIQLRTSVGVRETCARAPIIMTKTWMRYGWRSSLGLISLLRSSLRRTVTMRIRVFFISILLTRRRAYFQIRVTFRTRRIRTESTWRFWSATSSDSRALAGKIGDASGARQEGNHGRATKIQNGTTG